MTRKGRTEETLIALQRARRKKEEEKCKQDKNVWRESEDNEGEGRQRRCTVKDIMTCPFFLMTATSVKLCCGRSLE